MFHKLPKKQPRTFLLKVTNGAENFSPKTFKIAKSGHTDCHTYERVSHESQVSMRLISCETRFGEILPLWQIFDSFSLFGKLLSLLWQICDIWGLILIVTNGQILKNNLTIRLHCRQPQSCLPINLVKLQIQTDRPTAQNLTLRREREREGKSVDGQKVFFEIIKSFVTHDAKTRLLGRLKPKKLSFKLLQK